MIGKHFYNRTVKRAVIAFGTLFNNIVIQRTYKSGKTKVIPVQVAYGPREKWLELSKKKNQQFLQKLPKITFEATTLNYDVNRKLVSNNKVRNIRQTENGMVVDSNLVPTPYNLNFTMFIQAKTLDDGWQIIEQITPFFTPAYTLKVKDSSSIENEINMPITLTSVTWTDDYQGGPSDARLIEFSLEFDAKVNFYGPDTKGASGIILKTDTTVNAVSDVPGEETIDLSSIDRVINADGTFANQFTYDKGTESRYSPTGEARASTYKSINESDMYSGINYNIMDTYNKGQLVFHEGTIYRAEQDIPTSTPPGSAGVDFWRPFSTPRIATDGDGATDRIVISGTEGAAANPTEPTIKVLQGQGSSTPSPLPEVTFGRDSIPPTLVTWALDTQSGRLTLVFDEPVSISETFADRITLHGPNGSYTLTTATSPIGGQSNSTTVILNLNNDTFAVRSIIPITTDPANAALSALFGYAQDLFDNEALEIPVPSPVTSGIHPISIANTAGVSDTTGPLIIKFELNLATRQLEVIFDEALNTINFTYDGVNNPIILGPQNYVLSNIESFEFAPGIQRTLIIKFDETVRNEIDDSLGNPSTQGQLTYTVPADFVQDFAAGNFNTEQSPNPPSIPFGTFIPFDRIIPAITSWYLNINNSEITDSGLNVTVPANSVQIRFDQEPEGVLLSTVNPSNIFLRGIGAFENNTPDPANATIIETTSIDGTATSGSDDPTISKIVNIELTQSSLDLIERITQNGLQPIGLFGIPDYARDVNGNIPNGFGETAIPILPNIPVTRVFRDTDVTGPTLAAFDSLDLTNNTARITFNTGSDELTFGPATTIGAAAATASTDSIIPNKLSIAGVQLTDSTYVASTNPDGTVQIDFTLSETDSDNIRLTINGDVNAATISILEGIIQDTEGNLSTANNAGVVPTTIDLGSDTTRPFPTSFVLDLNFSEAVITFSETIDVNLFNYTTLDIDGVTLDAARILSATFDPTGTILTLILNDNLVDELIATLGTKTAALFTMLEAFVIDLDSNPNSETTGIVIITGVDDQIPVVSSWRINLDDNTSGANGLATPGNSIVINFIEQTGVRVSTVDLSKIFINGIGTHLNGSVNLEDGVIAETGFASTLTITFSGSKLDDIEKITYNATSPLSLSGVASPGDTYAVDRVGNEALSFSGLLPNTITKDPNGIQPVLERWTLNLDTKTMTIVYDDTSPEDVDLSTFNTEADIQVGIFPNIHVLRKPNEPNGSTINVPASGNTVTINLSDEDITDLISVTGNSALNAFLILPENIVLDLEGEPSNAIVQLINAIDFTPSSSVVADIDLESITLNLNSDTASLDLRFSRAVDPTTINLTAITFANNLTRIENGRIENGTYTLTANSGNVNTPIATRNISITLTARNTNILRLFTFNADINSIDADNIDSETRVTVATGLASDASGSFSGTVTFEHDDNNFVIIENQTDISRPSLASPQLTIDLLESRLVINMDENITHTYKRQNEETDYTAFDINAGEFKIYPNQTATGTDFYTLGQLTGTDNSQILSTNNSSNVTIALGIGPNPLIGTVIGNAESESEGYGPFDFRNNRPSSVLDPLASADAWGTESYIEVQIDPAGGFFSRLDSYNEFQRFLTDIGVVTGEEYVAASTIPDEFVNINGDDIGIAHSNAFEGASFLFTTLGVGFKISHFSEHTSPSGGYFRIHYYSRKISTIIDETEFGIVTPYSSNTGNLHTTLQQSNQANPNLVVPGSHDDLFFGASPPGIRFAGILGDDIVAEDDIITELIRGKDSIDTVTAKYYLSTIDPITGLPTSVDTFLIINPYLNISDYEIGDIVYKQLQFPPNPLLGDSLGLENLFETTPGSGIYEATNGFSMEIPKGLFRDSTGNPITNNIAIGNTDDLTS